MFVSKTGDIPPIEGFLGDVALFQNKLSPKTERVSQYGDEIKTISYYQLGIILKYGDNLHIGGLSRFLGDKLCLKKATSPNT